jgi:hypothetical protein
VLGLACACFAVGYLAARPRTQAPQQAIATSREAEPEGGYAAQLVEPRTSDDSAVSSELPVQEESPTDQPSPQTADAMEPRAATRIVVDYGSEQIAIGREIVFAPRMATGGDDSSAEPVAGSAGSAPPTLALLIPDVCTVSQVETYDRSFRIGPSEVRIVLNRYGPFEEDAAEDLSRTEVILWVNGLTRASGWLSGRSVSSPAVFESVSVHTRGDLVMATASRGQYPIRQFGSAAASTEITTPWCIYPGDCFPSKEEIDAALNLDSERGAEARATEGSDASDVAWSGATMRSVGRPHHDSNRSIGRDAAGCELGDRVGERAFALASLIRS